MTILQPPALPQDDKYPPRQLQLIERRIVWNLMHQLDAIGYKVVAVDDGGDERIRYIAPAIPQAFEDIFAVDEARLYVRHPDDAKNMVICFVMGNDGWDVVADHSDVPGSKFNEFMDKFDGEDYL